MSDETGRPQGTTIWINGPVVRVRSERPFRMQEVVKVGRLGLIGEVIGIAGDLATIQVYEDTSGMQPGEIVEGTGAPLNVELGPGLVTHVLDGIQRPLEKLEALGGDFIQRGFSAPRLDRERRWSYRPLRSVGDVVRGGDILGAVQETPLFEHRILVPPGVNGEIVELAAPGEYSVDHPLALVKAGEGTQPLSMCHQWEVRRPRPVRERLAPATPLVTGQRIIDVFFPIAKGGTAAIPGGFGTGKTVTQHNLAKWCDADLIVYIGCGERGNEMTGVLADFPELRDPVTGHPLIERTILVANTSNMPVAAREASIYTGVAIAEYFRDMGYHVAVLADSTSRWAEALREISGRLEEMPAEEGFPAYLATSLAEFYERAGRAETLCGAEGSITIIGAVSPPGGDFSEPVTQHTKRFVRCFWALDKELASARFFPSINVMDSYSEYDQAVADWWSELAGESLPELRERALNWLREEYALQKIVRLIGEDALPDEQKMVILAARLLKEGFLQQNAFDLVDRFAHPEKQLKMLKALLRFCDMGKVLVSKGIPAFKVRELRAYQALLRMKVEVENDQTARIETLIKELEEEMYREFPIAEREFFGSAVLADRAAPEVPS